MGHGLSPGRSLRDRSAALELGASLRKPPGQRVNRARGRVGEGVLRRVTEIAVVRDAQGGARKLHRLPSLPSLVATSDAAERAIMRTSGTDAPRSLSPS